MRVSRLYPVKSWDSVKEKIVFVENIKIVVESANNRFETLTDKNGVFTFGKIPAGEYIIKPVGGKEYRIVFPDKQEFRVQDATHSDGNNYIGVYNPYAGFYAEFNLAQVNRIDGRVVDSDGKALERYAIELLPVSVESVENLPFKKQPAFHENGYFEFNRITPGKYVLSVVLYAPVKDSFKKRRFFYPQTESLKDAKIFDLAETTKLTGIEIKLPVKK